MKKNDYPIEGFTLPKEVKKFIIDNHRFPTLFRINNLKKILNPEMTAKEKLIMILNDAMISSRIRIDKRVAAFNIMNNAIPDNINQITYNGFWESIPREQFGNWRKAYDLFKREIYSLHTCDELQNLRIFNDYSDVSPIPVDSVIFDVVFILNIGTNNHGLLMQKDFRDNNNLVYNSEMNDYYYNGINNLSRQIFTEDAEHIYIEDLWFWGHFSGRKNNGIRTFIPDPYNRDLFIATIVNYNDSVSLLNGNEPEVVIKLKEFSRLINTHQAN
jgi:hypothetical protein